MKKICSECKQEKDLSEYNISNKTKDGLPVYRGYCKYCQAIKDKKAREKRLEKNIRVSHKTCPICKQYLPNNEYRISRGSTTGLATYCKKCHSNIEKEYRKNETYKIRHRIEIMRKHQSKYSGISNFNIKDWLNCLEYFNNSCAYCGEKFDKSFYCTQDHYIPVSKNGNYTKDNIVPCCRRCNASKSNKHILEWVIENHIPISRLQHIDNYFEINKTIPSQI